jgi:hypothetical protein
MHPDVDDGQGQIIRDRYRGQYLCEVCEEAMTDTVLPATESPSGLELAICTRCEALVRSGD